DHEQHEHDEYEPGMATRRKSLLPVVIV
ncbi:MAG: hypothetical protein K0R70_2166, partial [Steroidobacteraceae bacterium]|nr:hypothetical protein [Steroidobacteraceae bacterium]